MFKIMTGIERIVIDPGKFFKGPPPTPLEVIDTSYSSPMPMPRRYHCLSVRAIDDWNRLSDVIFDVKSVN